MSDAPTTERPFRERFEELLEPFEEMLKLVRVKRAKAQTEVDRLRGEEREIVRALRAINPTFERNGKPKQGRGYPIADERIDAIREWLDAHRADLAESFPQGFTATDLRRHPDFSFEYGHDSVLAAVRKLHDRGVLRLDHRGKGGAKFYKAV